VKKKIRAIQYGVGPIGASIARLMREKQAIEIIGAIDTDPAKIGRDLGEVVGATDAPWGVAISGDAKEVLEQNADVVMHSTSSSLAKVMDQLLACLEAESCIVSTCEELSYPFRTHPELAAKLDAAAKEWGVALVGTGVNPGFVMDKLPLTITSVCQDVTEVQIIRIQNASTRREPLQRKVGAGMSEAEFRAAVDSGKIKHMGLRESLMLVGNGLGVDFESVSDEKIEPIVADREIVTQYLRVAPGQVAGVHQTIYGKGRINVSLELRMYVGAEAVAADRVIVKGVPDVEMEIKHGVHGDRATAAMVVNAIPRVVSARPGVLTMDDIPISFR
jgi:4-hydroxy-tetrahydrodipicolinate reductase